MKISSFLGLHSFLLFLLSIQVPVHGQEVEDQFKYRASYSLTYQSNDIDTASISSETMHLYLGDQVSKYMSRGKDLKDSIKVDRSNGFDQEAYRARAAKTKTEFNYTIYKHIPAQKIAYHLTILADHLNYEEELSLFNWVIGPASKTINGFQAQKAVTNFAGREYTAWFTPEIPISDGPYKFNGLPGLILEVRDSQDHYVFQLESFEELSDPVDYEPEEKFITTTKKKLLRTKRQFDEDPFTALENANTPEKTITIEISDEQKQKMLQEAREKLARNNNPIELQ